MVEEAVKSSVTEEPTNSNHMAAADDGEEPEEGEIVGDDGGEKPTAGVVAESHPLEHSWTFWFDNRKSKSKQSAWGSSLRSIYTFSTVEEFWSIYNNIHRPSNVETGTDFYCFKDKIVPKWEDPVCAKGGNWSGSFLRGKSDTYWLYTLLAMIGEQFDHGDEICGAVVNVRAKDKISIWTKNAANETAQVSIGRQWKKFLDYNDNIGFLFHDDALKLDRAAKNRYTV